MTSTASSTHTAIEQTRAAYNTAYVYVIYDALLLLASL